MGSDCRNNTDWRCRPWEAGLTWADLGQNGSYKNKLRLMIRVKRHLPKPRSVNNFSVPLSMGRRGPSLFWQELLSSQGWLSKREGKWGGGNIMEQRFKPNRMAAYVAEPSTHEGAPLCMQKEPGAVPAPPGRTEKGAHGKPCRPVSADSTEPRRPRAWLSSSFPSSDITRLLHTELCCCVSVVNKPQKTICPWEQEERQQQQQHRHPVLWLAWGNSVTSPCKSHHEPSSLGLATERWKRNRFHPDSPFSGGERFPMNRHPFLTGSGLDFVLQQLLNHVWF